MGDSKTNQWLRISTNFYIALICEGVLYPTQPLTNISCYTHVCAHVMFHHVHLVASAGSTLTSLRTILSTEKHSFLLSYELSHRLVLLALTACWTVLASHEQDVHVCPVWYSLYAVWVISRLTLLTISSIVCSRWVEQRKNGNNLAVLHAIVTGATLIDCTWKCACYT